MPYIFMAVADMVQWMATHNHRVNFLRHYFDDFYTLGLPASPFAVTLIFAGGHPAVLQARPPHSPSPDKLDGPTTYLFILGTCIELHSTTVQARLPAATRERIIALLGKQKCSCQWQELEFLIGASTMFVRSLLVVGCLSTA